MAKKQEFKDHVSGDAPASEPFKKSYSIQELRELQGRGAPAQHEQPEPAKVDPEEKDEW